MCTYPVQPVCTFLLHIPIYINIIKSTVDCIAHFISLHMLLLILFYFIFFLFCILFLPIFIYILLCYVAFFYLCFFFFFALSIERTCPDLHFTTDYTLHDCVCDE